MNNQLITDFVDRVKLDFARAYRLLPQTDMESLESISISHEYHRYDPNDPIVYDEHVIQIKQEGKYYRACTKSNSSLIDGLQKSRKTMLINLLVSCVLSKEEIEDTLVPNKKDTGLILYFDTEQAGNDIEKVYNRIKKKTGMEIPEIQKRLFIYRLAGKTPQEKENALLAFMEFHTTSISLVVIDGIADIYPNFNDPEEASRAVHIIDQIKYDYNCHVISIIHQSKGTHTKKGHLGSLLANKIETNFTLVSDDKNDCSAVKPGLTRGMSFNEFAIGFDDDKGEVVILSDYEPKLKADNSKAPKFLDLEDRKHYDIIKEVFSSTTEIDRETFMAKLKVSLSKRNLASGDSATKSALSHYTKVNQWVTERKAGSHKYFSFSEENFKLNGVNYERPLSNAG